jgi:hypothetical protein
MFAGNTPQASTIAFASAFTAAALFCAYTLKNRQQKKVEDLTNARSKASTTSTSTPLFIVPRTVHDAIVKSAFRSRGI